MAIYNPETAMTEKHRCAAKVYDSRGGSYACQKNATILEGERWWCASHCPSKVEARKHKRTVEWQAKWTAADVKQAEVARRLAVYPKLLAAAEAYLTAMDRYLLIGANEDKVLGAEKNALQAAIAEAKGKEV